MFALALVLALCLNLAQTQYVCPATSISVLTSIKTVILDDDENATSYHSTSSGIAISITNPVSARTTCPGQVIVTRITTITKTGTTDAHLLGRDNVGSSLAGTGAATTPSTSATSPVVTTYPNGDPGV
jgi:hypothetical protein